MCACRQKKTSFLIEDILATKPQHSHTNNDLKRPLTCHERSQSIDLRTLKERSKLEVSQTLESNFKTQLGHRRNTLPLWPTPVKVNSCDRYKEQMLSLDPMRGFNFFSEPSLAAAPHFAGNGLMSSPFPIRPYGFNRGCCSPWWGMGARRKGGQVRFSAMQTGALERRFTASKYLSPDERRALAATLRLSDRQVKTWFQNRRAKWRRSTPDGIDESPSSPENSDEDINIRSWSPDVARAN